MKAIQIHYNNKPHEAIRLCMLSVARAYSDYHVINDNSYHCEFVRASADYHRILLASENDDMVYVDTDCFVKEPLRLKGDLPYFAMQGGRPDIFYFAVNGRSDLFKQAIDKCYKGLPETYAQMVQFNKRISRFFRDKFVQIDRKTYCHIMAHKWSERVWLNKLNQGFCI